MDAGFPVFKGLQKPLEFMGLRGRFIYLAAAACGGAFFSFVIGNILFGSLAGFAACSIVGLTLLGLLIFKQRKGLYNRKKYCGIVVYRRLFANHLN